MADFDYGKAEADLDDIGCPHPDDIYEYKTEKGFSSYMKENGLNPDNYRKGSGSRQSYGSSGAEGCYITTACVAAKGLADDCDELRTLRRFRDEYLRNRTGGLEDIGEYYEKAPAIVNAINRREDASSIWNAVYTQMILPCVELIKEGRFDETYLLYKGFSAKLAEEYLLKG